VHHPSLGKIVSNYYRVVPKLRQTLL